MNPSTVSFTPASFRIAVLVSSCTFGPGGLSWLHAWLSRNVANRFSVDKY